MNFDKKIDKQALKLQKIVSEVDKEVSELDMVLISHAVLLRDLEILEFSV